jgi:CheY-like chemotaxis protein
MRICLIEDNAAVRDALALALEDRGYDLVSAADGLTGLSKVESHQPDIVITDLEMPALNGLGVIRRVRAQKPDIGIIAMSGEHMQAPLYLELAKGRGADLVLRKPFAIEALLDAITALSKQPEGTPA